GDRHALSEKPPRLTLIIRRMVVGEPGQFDQRPKRPWVILTKPCPRSLVGTAEGLFGLVNAFLSLLAVAKPYQNRRLDGDGQRSVVLAESPQPSRVDHYEEQQRQRRGHQHDGPPHNSERGHVEAETTLVLLPDALR